MSDSNQSKMMKSVGMISGLTLISRIGGLIRDILCAALFGTSAVWDAFLLAFTIPNFLRRVVGEGALSNAFVPVYSHLLRTKAEPEAMRLSNVLASILIVFVSGFCLISVALIQLFLKDAIMPEKVELVLHFLQILLPYIFFLSLVALFMGVQHCHKRFLAPALSPIILNAVWILVLVFICPMGKSLVDKADLLAWGILASGLIQLLVQIPALMAIKYKFRFRIDWRLPALSDVLQLLGPSILTFGAIQISFTVDMLLAYWLGDGANSVLWYGNRLMQLPLALFGISLGSVLLPAFSEQAATKDYPAMSKTLSYALRNVFFLTLPASIGLIVLARPIVDTLFQHGAFDAQATSRTVVVLYFYAAGLFAYAGQKVMASVLYGLHDAKAALRISLFSVGLNIVLNLILMISLREAGLALATALSGLVHFGIAASYVKGKVPGFSMKSAGTCFLKSLLLSLIMGASLWFAASILWEAEMGTIAEVIRLTILILAGFAIWFAGSLALKFPEIHELKTAFLSK